MSSAEVVYCHWHGVRTCYVCYDTTRRCCFATRYCWTVTPVELEEWLNSSQICRDGARLNRCAGE